MEATAVTAEVTAEVMAEVMEADMAVATVNICFQLKTASSELLSIISNFSNLICV